MEEDKFDKISRFQEEDLAAEEREQLGQEIANDPSLADELKLYKELQTGIQQSGRNDLRARLQAIANEDTKAEVNTATNAPKGQPQKTIFRSLSFRYAAAAVALVLVALTLYLTIGRSISPQALYADNFQAYPADLSSRGGNPEAELADALAPYQAADYPTAATKLAGYIAANPGEAEVRLILANAQLLNGQLNEARENLSLVARNPLLRDQANWYLALSYLKEDDVDTARGLLTKVVSSASGNLPERASELLEKLP